MRRSEGDGDPEDPREIEETLSKLMVLRGSFIDAHWHLFATSDAQLAIRARKRQIIFLARYGRQRIFDWLDRSVRELDEWFDALKELLDDEGGDSEAMTGEV